MEDRLSTLPDPIVCHILSFLPTKHSAATSILSKRWNSLWLSVFTLDLVLDDFSHIKTFDSVILLRDSKVPIQTLRLKCNISIYDDPIPIIQDCCNLISPLIMVATQRGLETLQLDMQWDPLREYLASKIFSCKTLTVLKLTHVSIFMKHLPRINDSHLKTLHLDHVNFGCNTDIINFLLLFPTLEELQTNVLFVDEFTQETEINKCLPNLMRATISDSEIIPLFLLSRALILSIKLTKRFRNTWPQVPTFHNLTQIELSFDLKNIKWDWMLEMLQKSPKLQHLIIEKMENADSEDNWQDPVIVPECLSSQLRTCLIKDFGGRKCELQFAEYIIRNSKVLRTMTIYHSCSIDLKAKILMLQKLSVCPRSCKLIFD